MTHRYSLVLAAMVAFLGAGSAKPEWRAHEIRQMRGNKLHITLPGKFQIVTESWNRVVAVPYIVYMPEKSRLVMLVSCDYPHQAMVLQSDDLGETWSQPGMFTLTLQANRIQAWERA